MTLIIDENKCARCGVCYAECPNEAIVQTEDSYVIDITSCSECVRHGVPLCLCEAVCPNDAIYKAKDSLYKKCLGLFS